MVNQRFPRGGYMNKLLIVDLDQGRTHERPTDPAMLRQYVGGTGLGARLLYDETVAGTDPFDGRNAVIIMTGPLTGTLVPGSGIYSVVARNTLTGLTTACQANGFFGARLKFAGYDGVIIRGRASRLVYLDIGADGAVLKDAARLAGKGTFATDRWLRKQYGEDALDHRMSVASIGPAGEQRVRFACLMSDHGHIASSGGVGALLGAKKLKAIVVRGVSGVPVEPARAAAFLDVCRRWRSESAKTALGRLIGRQGTLGLFSGYQQKGWVPVKNLTTNLFPGEEKFSAEHIREEMQVSVPRSCFGCTFNHCQTVQIRKGRYKGVVGEENEYETLAGFGPNWGIDDPGAATMLNRLNDDLGMDAKEVSFLISMMMEGYEKGLVSKAELDGLDLRWGDPETAADALRRISRREGIGDMLAEGVMRASARLGGEFPNLAVYVKRGNSPHLHDPRIRWGTLFSQIVSDMGSIEGLDLATKSAADIGIQKPAADPDTYMGSIHARTEYWRQFQECLTYCHFQTASAKTMVEALNVLTGSRLELDDALQVGQRVVNLLRMMSIREGWTTADDDFSHRLRTPPVDGPGKGKTLSTTFGQVLDTYYREAGWGPDGIPTADLLMQLDLDFTIKDASQ